MSNHLAIATVTAALAQAIADGINGIVSGAQVTTLRPDDSIGLPSSHIGVNVYLFRIQPNAALNNRSLPTRRADGSTSRRPSLALELNYLLTFYGDAATQEPELLLAATAGALSARPLITPSLIATALAPPTEGVDHHLVASDLAEALEPVRIQPMTLNLEELSKLWSVFVQQPYRLSAAYSASPVILEQADSPRVALPVAARSISVSILKRPVITSLEATAGSGAPISAGDTLVIKGKSLSGDLTTVKVGGTELTPTSVGNSQILVPLRSAQITGSSLDSELRAGIQGVRVVHGGLSESEAAALVLRPAITNTTYTTDNLEITLSESKLREGETVTVYLDPRPDETGLSSYTFEHIVTDVEADGGVMDVGVSGVDDGVYLIRVQVGGAESALAVNDSEHPTHPGYYWAPSVTVGS